MNQLLTHPVVALAPQGTSHVPFAGATLALEASAQTWNAAMASCSDMALEVGVTEVSSTGLDGENVVVFRDAAWCRNGTCDQPGSAYDLSETAITTIFFIDQVGKPDDGAILDADIEVNGAGYAIALGCEVTCTTSSTHDVAADLQNTLTHELGHLLGLDHTCNEGAGVPPLDGQCKPAPACEPRNALPAVITEATMYDFQEPEEIRKRTLTQDDVDGVCATYARP